MEAFLKIFTANLQVILEIQEKMKNEKWNLRKLERIAAAEYLPRFCARGIEIKMALSQVSYRWTIHMDPPLDHTSFYPTINVMSLDRTSRHWIGLHVIGSDFMSLDWTSCHWIRLHVIGLTLTSLDWTSYHWIDPHIIGLDFMSLDWPSYHWTTLHVAGSDSYHWIMHHSIGPYTCKVGWRVNVNCKFILHMYGPIEWSMIQWHEVWSNDMNGPIEWCIIQWHSMDGPLQWHGTWFDAIFVPIPPP